MRFEALLAFRYFFSRRNHPFVNVIKGIAVLGVAMGVAALVIVLAVMNGFEKDLKERVVGTFAHATVESDGPFEADARILAAVRGVVPGAEAVSPFTQGQILIESARGTEGVLVRGARRDEELRATSIGDYLMLGAYPLESERAVLVGDALADRLGVSVGDTVSVISPAAKKRTPAVVAGIFHSGMYEYDAHLVYAPLALSQEWFGLGSRVTGLALRYGDPDEAIAAKQALQTALGFPFYVRTWTDMNRSLFDALKLERTVMFVILSLIVAVACFNIIGTLTLLVIDRTKDIGVLRSLGAPPGSLVRIFTMSGLLIGFLGTLAGLGAGLGAAWAIERFPLIDIPSDIYYFGKLPVEIDPKSLALIAASSLGLTFLATLYPAVAAASLRPVQALRYE